MKNERGFLQCAVKLHNCSCFVVSRYGGTYYQLQLSMEHHEWLSINAPPHSHR